jgi:hypothetical protein
VSALLGALIGGISSYLVATQSNSYQAEAALLARKQTDYTAYLSAETDVQGAANTLRSVFERYEDSDINLLQQDADKYADAQAASVRNDFVISLIASPEVDKVRVEIARIANGISDDYHSLADDSKYRQHLNPKTVQHFGSQVDQLEGLFEDFRDAARADLHPKS